MAPVSSVYRKVADVDQTSLEVISDRRILDLAAKYIKPLEQEIKPELVGLDESKRVDIYLALYDIFESIPNGNELLKSLQIGKISEKSIQTKIHSYLQKLSLEDLKKVCDVFKKYECTVFNDIILGRVELLKNEDDEKLSKIKGELGLPITPRYLQNLSLEDLKKIRDEFKKYKYDVFNDIILSRIEFLKNEDVETAFKSSFEKVKTPMYAIENDRINSILEKYFYPDPYVPSREFSSLAKKEGVVKIYLLSRVMYILDSLPLSRDLYESFANDTCEITDEYVLDKMKSYLNNLSLFECYRVIRVLGYVNLPGWDGVISKRLKTFHEIDEMCLADRSCIR